MLRKLLQKIRIYSFGKAEKTDIGSGVLEERRKILWLPVAAAAAYLVPITTLAIGWSSFS